MMVPARVLCAAVVVNPTVVIYSSRSTSGSYLRRPRIGLVVFLTLTGIVGWRWFYLLGGSGRCQERLTPPTPKQEMMLQHFTPVGNAEPVESKQARATRLKLEWSTL